VGGVRDSGSQTDRQTDGLLLRERERERERERASFFFFCFFSFYVEVAIGEVQVWPGVGGSTRVRENFRALTLFFTAYQHLRHGLEL